MDYVSSVSPTPFSFAYLLTVDLCTVQNHDDMITLEEWMEATQRGDAVPQQAGPDLRPESVRRGEEPEPLLLIEAEL